jgi:antitoxin VapB
MEMVTTEVFRSSNSQAVPLPKQFRLTSDEIVLREKSKNLARAFELLCDLPDVDRDDTPPQEREGL